MHQQHHRVVVDDRHLCHQMVNQMVMMVCDTEMKMSQDEMMLVHQYLVLDY
jgi:hypothetical protein